MAAVVQNVASGTFANVTSKAITIAATTLGNLLTLEFDLQAGTTAWTSVTFVDNIGGNSYVKAISNPGTGSRNALIYHCLSIKAGVTSITATFVGGTGGAYGEYAVQEVPINAAAGGSVTLDQTGTGTATSTPTAPITATNTAVDTGAFDYCVAVLAGGNGNSATGIQGSPTTGWTDAFVQNDDNASAAGAAAYRFNNNTTPTDSCTWSITSGGANGVATGSPAAIASYKIVLPTAATPTASPVAGTYSSAQSVTLSSTTGGAAIYYTTDGSTPTTGSTLYAGAIVVSATTTIKAIAVLSGYANSSVFSGLYTILTPAATPTFSPAAGSYSGAQTVTISTTAPSPTIYYTTNGVDPTTASTVYSTPITVSVSETVKAICTSSGFAQSAVGSAAYVINSTAVAPILSPLGGSYVGPQSVSMSTTTGTATIYYTTDGSTPTAASLVYGAPITVGVSETLKAIAIASGFTNSTVTSQSYVITILPPPPPPPPPVIVPSNPANVMPYPGRNIPTAAPSRRTIDMRSLSYGLVGPERPEWVYQFGRRLFHEYPGHNPFASGRFPAKLPTPTFSPAGGTYTGATQVNIADASATVSIYYTVDGTPPTALSTLYTGTITVATTQTLSAIAIAVGSLSSDVATASYTVTGQAQPVTFSLPTGAYPGTQSIVLACATAGSLIYYTIDGSTPTTASTPYAGPITISSSETIKAYAIAAAFTDGGVTVASYVITTPIVATPTIAPDPHPEGEFLGPVTLTITTTTAGASLYYTTDGTTPTAGSTPYTVPVVLPTTAVPTQTIKAIGIKAGSTNSGIAVGIYGFGGRVAAPAASPPAGTYATTRSVTLAGPVGATIYYTTDGSTPTTSSSVYSTPLSVSATTTVKAIAGPLQGYVQSTVASFAYVIGNLKSSVISYFNSLIGTKVLSGSTPNVFIGSSGTVAQAMASINMLQGQTGQYPAMLAVIADCIGQGLTGAYPLSTARSIAQTHWAAGGFVQISPYIGNPTLAADSGGAVHLGNDGGSHGSAPISAAQLNQMVTPGTALNAKFLSILDYQATQLQLFFNAGQVALFRPFIEMNGAYNWFGGITGGTAFSDFQKLWIIYYNYLNVTKGLANNLIWVYNQNQDLGNYTDRFPGLAYVDMASLDIYPQDANTEHDGSAGFADKMNGGNAYSLLSSLGVPFFFSECGLAFTAPPKNSCDNTIYIKAIKDYGPKTMAFLPFDDENGGYFSLANQNNASQLLNNASVINLAQITLTSAGGGGGSGGSDFVPPSQPANLIMTLQGQHAAATSVYNNATGFWDAPFPNSTSISWDSATPGTNPISGNNIWRSKNGGTPVKLNGSLNTTTSWIDDTATLSVSSVPGAAAPYYTANTYTYQIEEIDSLSNSSGLSASQTYYAYKNGVAHGFGGDFSGTNGGTATVNYNDTVGDPAGCIKLTWTGSYGYFLPWHGNELVNYNFWAGGFSFLSFEIKAVTETKMPQMSVDRVGDVPIYNRLNGTTGASGTSFDLTPYASGALSTSAWTTVKIPFQSLLLDYGPPSAPYSAPVLQLAVYKYGIQSTSGNAGSFYFRNFKYTPS